MGAYQDDTGIHGGGAVYIIRDVHVLRGTDARTVRIIPDTAPIVTISAPTNGHRVTEGTVLNFTGTVSDTLDGTISNQLDWYSSIDDTIANNTASFTTTSLSAGTHTITANVTDSDGNVGSASISVNILADAAPIVTISAPTNGHRVTEGTTLNFMGNATDTFDSALWNQLDWLFQYR